MKKLLLTAIVVAIPAFIILVRSNTPTVRTETIPGKESSLKNLTGLVKPGETLQSIFESYRLDSIELAHIYDSSKKILDLSRISAGDLYSIDIDNQNSIQNFRYEIDDLSYLKVSKNGKKFEAERVALDVERKISRLFIRIKDNLMYSMPGFHSEYKKLALKLADIYAWDIDFSSDIRNGDTVKLLIEELWYGNVFIGFGDILAAEFVNNGNKHLAYRFEHDGIADYHDAKGRSLRKTLLRSPVQFKYISSRFSKRRLHPKLRIYRPHLGVDYAAPRGTPVSAAGNGRIIFAGYKGQNGKLVRIKHNNGYETFYGHLSKIPRRIRKGARVKQGDIIGYVGSTGLATGPHLDYRIKFKGRFIDPLKLKLPRGKSIPKKLMASFRESINYYNAGFELIDQPVVAKETPKNLSWTEGG